MGFLIWIKLVFGLLGTLIPTPTKSNGGDEFKFENPILYKYPIISNTEGVPKIYLFIKTLESYQKQNLYVNMISSSSNMISSSSNLHYRVQRR